jgi:uncharacterized repeat protein (TIGR03803 family)
LYRFCRSLPCDDGLNPTGGLLMDEAGNLFGMTAGGGAPDGAGTVFELTPDKTRTRWAEKVLHRFCAHGERCGGGRNPVGGLIRDEAGNFFGTTYSGGTIVVTRRHTGSGVAFKLTPDGVHRTWAESLVHRLCDPPHCPGDRHSGGSLVMDSAGNLYGTASYNGINSKRGVVFKLTPDAVRTGWTYTVLHTFCSLPACADGGGPDGGLIVDAAGSLYGTAASGGIGAGVSGGGVVFELTPDTTRAEWTERVLYSFCAQSDCADGKVPTGGLVMDGAGNLYGTTVFGGLILPDAGVVFELTPDATRTTWTYTVLHQFCSRPKCADGGYPDGGLIIDGAGNLYGVTSGVKKTGVVYELVKSP